MNTNVKRSLQIVLSIAIIGCVVIGFLGLNMYCVHESSLKREYVFKDINSVKDGLSISVTVSKSWEDSEHNPELPWGAQYDGVVENRSKIPLKNWTARLRFSDEVKIDSSWNGEFSSEGNVLFFEADEKLPEVIQVKQGRKSTFGAILYSHDIVELKSCILTGYKVVTPSDLPLFYVLIFVLILWLLSVLLHVVIEVRTARYRKNSEQDKEIIEQSMKTFIGFIDAKDAYTKGHSNRVAAYSKEIARRMKMNEEQIQEIYYITLMHDCGKIGIPDAVLKKPGHLTPEEYDLIKSHTNMGGKVLEEFTAIKNIRDGALYHHECYDGSGYPKGLKGEEIPIVARIIGVADAYDAMSSTRCYRPQLDDKSIYEELTKNSGKQFDPKIVSIMVEMIKDGFADKIRKTYPQYEG